MILVSDLKKWCNKHNATYMGFKKNGFMYMTANGMMWFMTFDEWKEQEMQK